jgi:hypothetical protein
MSVSVADVTGTALVPPFHSVMTTGVRACAPRPVVGNASVGHVMTKVDGAVAGVVEGEVVLLEQPPASNSTNRR